MIVLKKLSENRLKTRYIIELLLILFSSQSSNKIARWNCDYQKKLKHFKNEFECFLAILIICSFILTKSFTGLLLNSYFNEEFVPFVNYLGDVYEKEELNIAGRLRILNKFEDSIDKFSDFTPRDILRRIFKYQGKLNTEFIDEKDVFTPNIIENMIMRKTVILIDSNTGETILDIYSKYLSMFTVCKQAYLPQPGYLLAKKDHFLSDLVKFLYVNFSLNALNKIVIKINLFSD